jgi:eukaryotic-like serine/threonine-protein kinase
MGGEALEHARAGIDSRRASSPIRRDSARRFSVSALPSFPIADALEGRYVVERELGRGGSATVYLAEDQKHRRRVAVKVLDPLLAADASAERFLREIATAARLNHPHILPLFDSGHVGDILYYVMPYVDGESLRGRLTRERQLPINEAVRLAREVAQALHYAHGEGVVHRDVKPENILLSRGHALVADFGIARALRAPAGAKVKTLTETGVAIGTLTYMSPEQVTAERDVGPCSDVYSLGCVLYEMIAGVPPHTGRTEAAVIARRLSGPAPSLARARPEVTSELDLAVARALEIEPTDRFRTAAELDSALAQHDTDGFRALSGTSVARRRTSIAVLPFASIGASPEDEYFADGITEDIIARLGRIGSLKVISRTSVMRFKGTEQGMREVAETLGVETVLEGSVRRTGERLRITAQLVDAHADEPMWSETFDRHVTDVFEVQADVADAIAVALRLRLSEAEGARLRRQPSMDIETYNLCLLGRHAWHRWTEPDFRQSIEYYDRALTRDPDCAIAHFGRGLAYGTLALGYFSVRGPDYYPEAKAALERALALDPDLAEAHSWLGCFQMQHEYAWAAAEARFRRALALDPTSAAIRDTYSWLLTATGRHDDAARESARAVELDPLSHFVLVDSALMRYRRREYEASLELFQREIALDPWIPMAHLLRVLPLVELGRAEEAVTSIEHALRLGGEPGRPFLALALAAAGRVREARDVLTGIEARRATFHAWPVALALAYTRLGDQDTAIQRLREGFHERDMWITSLAVDPGFDPLRGDARFMALLDDVGLMGS